MLKDDDFAYVQLISTSLLLEMPTMATPRKFWRQGSED